MKKFVALTAIVITLLIVFGVSIDIISKRNEAPVKNVAQKVEKTFFKAKERIIKPPNTTVFLVGDIMLGRSVMGTSIDAGDMSYPFANVSTTLSESDIVFANLENPITTDCQRHVGGFKFCAPPSMLQGLTMSGINIVTLANNHSRNYGTQGLEETLVHLDNAGIKYTGLGELTTMEVNDTVFGFLGFDFFSNTPADADLQLIRDSNGLVDVLIVGIHWGVEYTDEPLEVHKELAQKIVDAGADIISGHHPHWVQSIEYIDGEGRALQVQDPSLQAVPVYYSLGNFVFDQMWSEETKKGLAIKLTFNGENVVEEKQLHTYMPQFAQPVFVANNPED